MTKIQEFLFANQDMKYRDFTLPLIPNIAPETFIGVRLPVLKKYAKEIGEAEKEDFLNSLLHPYHEENILHAFILSNTKDYEEFLRQVNAFLPYVSNWSVCDTICNKHLNKYKDRLIKEIDQWLKNEEPYRVRYAVKCLMNYYLGEDFRPEHLTMVRGIELTDYYVRMMIAWYLATGLAKNYDAFVKPLEENWFEDFTHNKAIQKALESYRVSDEHKAFLKGLKRK